MYHYHNQYLWVLIVYAGPLDRRVQLNCLFSWFYCNPVAFIKGFTQIFLLPRYTSYKLTSTNKNDFLTIKFCLLRVPLFYLSFVSAYDFIN